MLLNEYMKFVKELKEERDILGDDYTACWMYAYYIHKKYELPIKNGEAEYEKEEEISEINLEKEGIYSYFMEHKSEMHHYVLFVKDNNVNLSSTYGGQEGIISKNYIKNDFIDMIKELKNTNIEKKEMINKYKNLFGIEKVYFNELDLTEMKFYYSYTPFKI